MVEARGREGGDKESRVNGIRPREEALNDTAKKQLNGAAEKRRNCQTRWQRSGEAAEQGGREAEKQPNRAAEKRRSRRKRWQRNREAAGRGDRETDEREGKERERQDRTAT